MNYVAIDPSLTCTAMVVNDKKFVYTTAGVAHTKKAELKRWFAGADDLVTYRIFDELPYDLSHSDLELKKLFHYDFMVYKILKDVLDNIDHNEPVHIGIEGYSYSSSAGPLIDLVTFSTLLRSRLFGGMPGVVRSDRKMVEMRIFQPTEVKQRAAMLAYPPLAKNKAGTKVEYRNNEGVAGGSFKKHEIYKALIENKNLVNDPWIVYLKDHWEEIKEMKSIPKPIEDVNDAKTLYEIIKAPVPLDK